MKAHVFVGALLVVIAIGAADRLSACGDKYLTLGLGTHYSRSAAERRAAAVLLYATAGSELAQLVTGLSVEAAMNKVGYHPTIAVSPSELDTALRKQNWDVVVVDGRDTQTVVQRLQKTAPPHVVPVLTKPTKDELKQAERIYDTVLNTPTKTRPFVDVVDDAMDLHEMETAAATKAAKRSTR